MLYQSSTLLLLLSFPFPGISQETEKISLDVPAGTPLRVYLTKRISKRVGEPVEARLLGPLYSFDREVAPAGCEVLGSVVRIEPVSKDQRAAAILAGDFTPLHDAEI